MPDSKLTVICAVFVEYVYGGYTIAKKERMLWIVMACKTYIVSSENPVNSGYFVFHHVEVWDSISTFYRENK